MISEVPKRFFLVSGKGEAPTPLNAFDAALREAGIGDLNLLKVSSIIPPGCRKVKPFPLSPGTFTPIAYASITSSLPGEVISAGVAVGIPTAEDRPGVIMEYSARGRSEEIEEIVENMARYALEMRNLKIASIECKAVEVKVEHIAAAFAGVILI